MKDAWLKITSTGISGNLTAQMLSRFGSLDEAMRATPAQLTAIGVSANDAQQFTAPNLKIVDSAKAWLDHPDHHLITWDDERYPILLREIEDSPAALYVIGDPELPGLPQFAIVGSRSATPAGRETAGQFSSHLARTGFSIASGLALGIDTAAHRAALATGGRTLAVLAHGPDLIYPRENESLAGEISQTGSIVTEFAPGSPPLRHQFPRRNRIISGLSVGVLVVEAGLRSGALTTARCASEQGREVFAIPGSIHNPVARGCHQLIRAGAKLVETAEDIEVEIQALIETLSNSIEQNTTTGLTAGQQERDPAYSLLLEHMGWDPVSIDTLVKRSGLTADEVSSMLLILELEGRVQPLTGGCYSQREEKGRPNERNRA